MPSNGHGGENAVGNAGGNAEGEVLLSSRGSGMSEPNDTWLVHEHLPNRGRVESLAGGQFLGGEHCLVSRSGIL